MEETSDIDVVDKVRGEVIVDDFLDLEQLLIQEFGWLEHHFLPPKRTAFGSEEHGYAMCSKSGAIGAIVRSKPINHKGWCFATEFSAIFGQERVLKFLDPNTEVEDDGWEEHVLDLKALGIFHNFLNVPLEVVGFQTETVVARPHHLPAELNWDNADKGVKNYFHDTGNIRFGAFLLTRARYVKISTDHKYKPRKKELMANQGFNFERLSAWRRFFLKCSGL